MNHVRALETKHAELDQQIADEQKRPKPDELSLQRLKKAKLSLKDEIARETEPERLRA